MWVDVQFRHTRMVACMHRLGEGAESCSRSVAMPGFLVDGSGRECREKLDMLVTGWQIWRIEGGAGR